MQFNHVGISVSSLDRSVGFYRDVMEMDVVAPPFPLGGEEVEQVTGLRDLKVQVAVVSKGNLMLELFEFENPVPQKQDPRYPVNNHGITHFGITVDDIDAMWERLTRLGVHFHSPVRQFPGGIRAAYGRDPDGNVFELLEMPNRV